MTTLGLGSAEVFPMKKIWIKAAAKTDFSKGRKSMRYRSRNPPHGARQILGELR
jgi:hypothetical protein